LAKKKGEIITKKGIKKGVKTFNLFKKGKQNLL